MKPQAGGGATWFVQHRLKCKKANSGEFQNQEFQIQRQKTKIARSCRARHCVGMAGIYD